MDWVLPTDEILAVLKEMPPEDRSVVPPKAVDSDSEHGLAWQLRKLTTHLKQVF